MIFFVTPAWQRVTLTAVCLEQRRRVIKELAKHGVEARCVVVADDDTLDVARLLGFDTVRQNNDWLGRKFNDGIEYAAKHGATWIVPIGSDSFVDPAYFWPLPEDKAQIVRTSQLYAPVELNRLAITRVGGQKNPAGPHMFHRDLLKWRRFRPMPDQIKRNTDSNTLKALPPFRWEFRDVHELQYIGFRAKPYITEYGTLVERWGINEYSDPWERLAKVYPKDLVERAQRAMA